MLQGTVVRVADQLGHDTEATHGRSRRALAWVWDLD